MNHIQDTKSSYARTARWLALAVILGCYLLLLDSPGSPDVPGFWLHWIASVHRYGLVGGYAYDHNDYLPGTFVCFWLIDHAAQILNISVFLGLKITITLFAFAGAIVYWLWARNFWCTIALLAAVLLNSTALGYLDSFYLPFMLLLFWSLQGDRLFYAGLFLGVSLTFKWQPLLVAPFVLIYAFGRPFGAPYDARRWRRIARFLLGFVILPVTCASVFRATPIVDSFNLAISHHALSLQGLNMSWVIQTIIYRMRHMSGATFLVVPPPVLFFAVKRFFILIYGVIAAVFLFGRQKFTDFVWCAFLGSFAYFTLNVGVHENHLFTPMIAAFCLVNEGVSIARPVCIFCALSANINLIFFYSLLGVPRTAFPLVEPVAILICLLNSLFFWYFFYYTLKRPAVMQRLN